MKERKRKITVITVIGIMLILAITTFTYAIWSRTHTQTGINKNTYACFDISYEETNGGGISIENGFPQKDEDGLKNKPYEVEIKNTCDTVSTYNVILNKEQSSDLANEHLKVAVDNDYKLLSDATPTDNRTIEGFQNEKSYIIGTGVIGPKQTKIVQIRSWMDKDTTEEQGENKSFTFKITIENAAGDSNLLAGKILTSNKLQTEEPDFSKGYPNSTDISLSGLYKTEDGDGDSYYFRGKVENNYVQLGINKEDAYLYLVGQGKENETTYSSYEDAKNRCNNNYNSDYNYGSAEACIQDIQTEVMQTSGQSILWRIVRINGDGTIRLVTDNPISVLQFNETGSGYQYVGYTYNNNEPCTNDNPCSTYYNGSNWTSSENMGTSSTIKEYLEDWYNTTLKNYDDKIALTKYCNDTSYDSGSENNAVYYGPYKRIMTDSQPSLQCPDPTKQDGNEKRNYGGIYKLKIGLLTVDEVNYAGLAYASNATGDNYLLNYLKNNNKFYWYMWTMSPSYASSSYAYEFYGFDSGDIDKTNVSYNDHVVRPVINLNSDVTVTGTGTVEDPYIVQ